MAKPMWGPVLMGSMKPRLIPMPKKNMITTARNGCRNVGQAEINHQHVNHERRRP